MNETTTCVRARRAVSISRARVRGHTTEKTSRRARGRRTRERETRPTRGRDARARCDDPTTRVEGNAAGMMGDCVGSREPCIHFNGSRRVEESPSLAPGRSVGRSVGRVVRTTARATTTTTGDDDGRRAR